MRFFKIIIRSPFVFYLMIYKNLEFMFLGINMFWTRLRLTLARAARRGLKWALWRAYLCPRTWTVYTITITLESSEKIKTEKITSKQSEQSRKRFQVKWLSFSLKYAIHQAKLAKNDKILPFEFLNCKRKESSIKLICKWWNFTVF